MEGDKITTGFDDYCALVNQRDKYWEAMVELVEAYGEMEKGIDDEILCHYNSMRLHNAVEDQRALVLPGYIPDYMPGLDDGTDDPRCDTADGKADLH